MVFESLEGHDSAKGWLGGPLKTREVRGAALCLLSLYLEGAGQCQDPRDSVSS